MVLVIALVTLACIATVAMADNHKDKKNKDRQNFNDDSAVPSIRPMPTLEPLPVASPTPTPIPIATITPIPTPEPLTDPMPTPEPAPVQVLQSLDSRDVIPTLEPDYRVPTSEPTVVPVNNSSGASPSQSAAPTSGITSLPTPLVSDVELTRPGNNIGILFALLSGLACAGYFIYLGYTIIRK